MYLKVFYEGKLFTGKVLKVSSGGALVRCLKSHFNSQAFMKWKVGWSAVYYKKVYITEGVKSVPHS